MELTRRTFLKFSMAASGALLVRVSSHAFADDGSSSIASSPYLILNVDNSLTLTLSQVEMGQGIDHALKLMVAEELDLQPEQIHIVQPTYSQDSLKGYKAYRTGGSYSVRRNWSLLREAAASLRARLMVAAAQKMRVPVQNLKTRNGLVIYEQGKKQFSYSELAAQVPQVGEVDYQLKSPSEFKLLGQNSKSDALKNKVSGQQAYVLDFSLPGQKVAVIERGPYLGSKYKSFDATEVMKSDGVVSVIEMPNGIAIIADSYWQAIQAKAKLKVEWAPDESISSLTTKRIAEAYKQAALKPGRVVVETNKQANNPVESLKESYSVPFLTHATMEPMNCVAQVENGRCSIWAPTQDPFQAQTVAANISGINREKINVFVLPLGGGFGRRLHQDYVAEAVFLAAQCDFPVKVVWPREDDIKHGFYRPKVDVEIEASLSDKGEILALNHKVVGPGQLNAPLDYDFYQHASAKQKIKGAIENLKHYFSPDEAAGTLKQGVLNKHYGFPNHNVVHHHCDVGVPLGYWRSVGHYPNVFAVESFIDMVADRYKTDPIEYRLNLIKNNHRLVKVIEELKALCGWQELPPEKGVAVFAGYNSYAALAVTLVKRNGKKQVESMFCVADCGVVIDPDTVKAQIEGGLLFGLSSVLGEEITVNKGQVNQSNFHDYQLLKIQQSPSIVIQLINSQEDPGGVGELAVPLVAPAICNSLATMGKRQTRLPLNLG